MGFVAFAEEQTQTLRLAVRQVQLARCFGEVDERYILLCCYDFHRLHVTHGGVTGRQALVLVENTVLDLGELITEVVLTITADFITVEIRTADRTYQDRRNTHRTCLIDEMTQHLAIGGLRVRTACIGRSRETVGCTISSVLQVVHTVGHGTLVVVSKLDDEVVSCAHLALYGRPISSSGVETTGVGSRLTTVINCDESRIEERTEVHTPASFIRRTLIILRHR